MSEIIKSDKKPWQKPELLVLVRSNPEDAVLALGVCKLPTTPVVIKALTQCTNASCKAIDIS